MMDGISIHHLMITELRTPNIHRATDLRKEIIVDGMGYQEKDIIDNEDEFARHFLMHTEEVDIGTLRVFKRRDFTEFSFLAVKEEYRKRGFAAKLLHDMIDKFNEHEIRTLVTNSAIPFFEKSGFKKIGKEVDIFGSTKGYWLKLKARKYES